MDRFCAHGNLRLACKQCKLEEIDHAHERAARNRERGEIDTQARMDEPVLHYPWQREAFDAWSEGGRSGLVALSHGLPLDDLPFAAMALVVNANPSSNVLFACAPDQRENLVRTLEDRFGRNVGGLVEHHFLEPRGDAQTIVADVEELATVDLASWGRFATNGLVIVMDADGVGQHLGQQLLDSAFSSRLCVSRMPSAVDLLVSRPWARGFGPLLYRYTEDQARDIGVLPRIDYLLHVETLRPEPGESQGPEGPWSAEDVPTRLPYVQAGQFSKGRARDVAARRAKETEGLVVVAEGVPIPGARTVRLKDLPEREEEAPSGWVLASPEADQKAVLRLATLAFKTLQATGHIEDVVVVPVPKDLCRVPPWSDKWRGAAMQIDRVLAGLLLAEDPGKAMSAEDLEALVGVALALRGIPAEDLYAFTPVVEQAARIAHEGGSVPPDQVTDAARAYGGLAAALLVAAESGPLHLLRLAHPRVTPVVVDLPHPSIYDAKRHAWRGRAFAALAQAKGDMVATWGRHPELRFVFPSSTLLHTSTAYCARHKLKGPLDEAALKHIDARTRILDGTEPELGPERGPALAVLKEWNTALETAERFEREFLADMHARQPERERRREGVALPGLRVVDTRGDLVTFETDGGRLPATDISPGSEVAVVEQGDRREAARGHVSKMSNRRITVEFRDGAPRGWPRHVTVNLVFDPKVFEAYHSAVLAAMRSLDTGKVQEDSPDGLLRAALLGEVESGKQQPQSLALDNLTESQRASVNRVLSGGRVHLVHGPPGTGKTHTLVHLAVALTRAGHSVLCTADSNAAVDNLVVGLRRAGALVVRVAHAPNLRDDAAEPARIDPLEAPPFVRWAAGQGIVVATTNYGAYRYLDPKGGMNPFTFDYVIHDEAGQSTAPSSMAAMMRGRRLVLAGDPKQLPPTVVSIDAKEAGLDVTLFERIEELTGRGRTSMLKTQFRMREPIVAFSNERYYEGAIETAPSAAAQEGLPDLPALAFQHVTGKENPRQRNGSISNDWEVDCIRHVLEQVRPVAREKGWTMAILTPYQAQREQLRRILPDIEVSTVDGAQGREWDIVFYSSVRSNPKHRLGFVSDERRLNVAVTRARRNFILVGDERTLRDHEGLRLLVDTCEKIRLFYPERDGQIVRGQATGTPPRRDNRPREDGPKRRRRRRRRSGEGTDNEDRGRRGRGDQGDQGGASDAPRKRRRGSRGRGRDPPDAGPEPAPPKRGRGNGSTVEADRQTMPEAPKKKRGKQANADGRTGPAKDRTKPTEEPAKAKGPGKAAKAPGKAKGSGQAAKGSGKAAKKSGKAAKAPGKAKANGKSAQRTENRCTATTAKGERCKLKSKPGSTHCARHS